VPTAHHNHGVHHILDLVACHVANFPHNLGTHHVSNVYHLLGVCCDLDVHVFIMFLVLVMFLMFVCSL
jgi:hypothetical protein